MEGEVSLFTVLWRANDTACLYGYFYNENWNLKIWNVKILFKTYRTNILAKNKYCDLIFNGVFGMVL